MEYVVVRFPGRRTVNVNGAAKGKTGRLLKLSEGTHRFELGGPADYKPVSQRVSVSGTTKSEPAEVVFQPRHRERATSGKVDRRKETKVRFRTPTRVFSFDPPKGPAAATAELQRAAMHWSYVVRNRKRWAGLPVSVANQTERARSLLTTQLGLAESDLNAIAADGIVEVEIPFMGEASGWEARIFPWEFVLASATREARHGKPLSVMRRLVVPGRTARVRKPARVLFVESAPGKLADLFTFDTERDLVRSSLRPRAQDWRVLANPTLSSLRATVRQFKPDIIHLAGFDSHQGLRLLAPTPNREQSDTEDKALTDSEGNRPSTPDGYLLAHDRAVSAGAAGAVVPVDAETLAAALCIGGHRPELVVCSLQNSAARIAALAVAHGAQAAIGFQDVFDDDLAELFFASFYRAWRKGGWHLVDGFTEAWKVIREQPASVTGTGIVLWSGRPLVGQGRNETTRQARPSRQAPEVILPGTSADRSGRPVLSFRIEPVKELNYSLLHNRCALFEHFTLLNGSADRDVDRLATLADVDVAVTLSAGAETAAYQRRLSLQTPSLDLKGQIHVPLTSELMRSVHESINSSLLVEVAWGNVIYRDSHLIRLLPVDQWRDNEHDGQWLPSFVLPRDPAIAHLIDSGQRYVRVLRDDPSAGFDGYQSVDPGAKKPAGEVDRQVQAIWSTIVHELNLGYVNPPPTYSSAMDSQRLRTPSMIVKDRSGTCIDLALLLAACCELVDIYPVLFLLKDHAFPGYWREDRFQQEFIELADGDPRQIVAEDRGTAGAPGAQRVPWWFRETAYDEILRQVKLGRLVPMESVWLTEHRGFLEAVEGGQDNLKKKSRFHSMLDIARAREAGVTPLPFGGR